MELALALIVEACATAGDEDGTPLVDTIMEALYGPRPETRAATHAQAVEILMLGGGEIA